MAVVNLNATLITNIEAMPPALPGSHQHRGPIHRSWSRMSKAATDNTNSLYRVLRVHSSMLLSAVEFLTDAWGASGSVDIGFYDTPTVNAGAIVGTGQELIAALDVSAAITTKKELANVTQLAMTQRVWERLGLASDPNKDYDIVVKAVNVGAAQLANFFLSASYQR